MGKEVQGDSLGMIERKNDAGYTRMEVGRMGILVND